MTVFKGYMKVIRQSRWLILMYVAIFFACTLLMQSAAGKTEKSFQAESLKIGIADEDGGGDRQAHEGEGDHQDQAHGSRDAAFQVEQAKHAGHPV